MKNILNNTIRKNYHGYLLQNIYNLYGEPLGIESMKKFSRIPYKITAFIDKQKIKAVYQYKIKGQYFQYFIQFSDNSWKELEY